MKIKKIKFIEEVKDIYNDNIDVFVEKDDGSIYTQLQLVHRKIYLKK